MIHLYCGDGKGKTTAAFGLALRCAGRGMGVVVAQFLKSEDSGERTALSALPQVTLLPLPERVKFSFQLSPEEREAEARRSLGLLREAERLAAQPGCGLLVLDEVCAALSSGLLPLPQLLPLLERPPCELVLTGRNPPQPLLDRADYITEMQKIRHPFDQGLPARAGIEF